MILIVDDDKITSECLMRILAKNGTIGQMSSNVIDAINIIDSEIPEMVFMDVFLTGPDGFTLLNEMASYADTAKIPVVIVSEKDFSEIDLRAYGVVGALNKNTMVPGEVLAYVKQYAN